MKLLIIRHGDPDYTVDNLTEQGRREAQALAAHLEQEPVDRIFSSPLGRAKATASYTADALKLPVEIEPWSYELQLRMTESRLMAWDLPAYLMGGDRRDCAVMKPHMTEAEYANSCSEAERVARESDAFLARLGFVRENGAYRITQPSRERIAFFCHNGLGLTWLAHLLCIPLPMMWGAFFLATTSITEVLFDERVPGIATARCLCVGALPHLPAAGMRPGRSGIKGNYE